MAQGRVIHGGVVALYRDGWWLDDGKDPAAKALGAEGGKARASSMSPERRSEIAKVAASMRWAKD